MMIKPHSMMLKRIMCAALIAVLHSSCFILCAEAQVSVESSIDSLQIFVGEQTCMHVSVNVRRGQNVQFQPWQPGQMVVPGVEVVGMPSTDTIETGDGFIKVVQHLQLTSFDDTLYYIPAQKVKVDGKEYAAKSLALKVLTIDVDTLHPNQFFGPKDVQDNPFLWSEWTRIFWLAFLAGVLYLLCLLAYVRLKSNKPLHLRVRIVKRIPPHQRALSEIETLRSEWRNSGEAWSRADDAVQAKEYYTRLTDTLRKYMQERFGFNAMEMTSNEIIERLRQEEDQSKIQELTMLFETADLVKFAKYAVGMNENDRNLVSAVDFINNTKQENVPTEERIEPTVTEQQRQTMKLRLSLKWIMALLTVVTTALVAYVVYQLWEMLS